MAEVTALANQVAEYRALAARARRLARSLNVDADRLRLLSYAEELEEKTNELQRQATTQESRDLMGPPSQPQVHMQVQVQQQQGTELKPEPTLE